MSNDTTQLQPARPRHELKTDPESFDEMDAGRKTFEIRLDDRGYAVGDELELWRTEYTGEAMRAGAPLIYTKRAPLYRIVTHVMRGPIYGLVPGWVIMSVAPIITGVRH